ncbi:uncharacterized protein LOC124262390 [Haliotis rubra]|uniref:uncharacterized protein LOC124262390 n=1 Tax=Haliotis rubra TaxID=36100 RepID=UPI001EE58F33|nr:uncharacterized protein LOC124262390 [Haliotis rubra]
MMTLDVLLCFTAICSVPIITATPCPGVALWESAYEITGNRQNFSGFFWVRPNGGDYVVTCNPDCSETWPYNATYSATYNTTHSTLHINHTSKTDSGLWKFNGATKEASAPVCDLTTANLPTCNISSDLDPHSLEEGTVLSLTVDVSNYFCSRGAGFELTTGDITDTLLQNETVTDYTNATLNSTFNVTLQSLGDVLLSFSCLNSSWDLPCTGVKQLLKSPPTCNITSDVETDDLELGTEVTLSVDIRNYYCSEQAGFNLTTGRVEEVLHVGHEVYNVSRAISNMTFNTTTERFGKVLVKFSCDNYHLDLVCDGIKELVKGPPTCNITSDVETDDLELGTEVTLSVDIRNYYCSEQAGFNLTTGRVEEVLHVGHEVDNVASEILNMTFNTTNERFGKVLVKFSCDNYDLDLVCDGIKELVKKLPTTSVATTTRSTKPSNTPRPVGTQTTVGLSPEDPGFPLALVVGVCAGVPVFVIIVVVVVLNHRKITAVARQYIVNRNAQSKPYEQGLDNSTSDPTLDMTDSVAFDEIKLDNVEKVDDSKPE